MFVLRVDEVGHEEHDRLALEHLVEEFEGPGHVGAAVGRIEAEQLADDTQDVLRPLLGRDIHLYLICEDDQADYVSRFDKLAKGKLEFAVATVDSYLLNGLRTDYPATIISVLDESKGGDAIVARRSVFPTIDALNLDNHMPVSINKISKY